MTAPEWIMAFFGGVGILFTAGGVIYSHGRLAQRVIGVEVRQKEQADEISGMQKATEATTKSVDLLAQDIKNLANRWDDQQKLAAVELGRVVDQIKSGNELINVRLEAMDKFTRSETEQVKHDVRSLRLIVTAIDERSRPTARQASSRA